MSTEELDSTKVRLKSSGDLVIRVDGKEVVIAHYTKETGTLEFTTMQNSVLYGQACAMKIGTVSQGKDVSGNVIRNIRVKGDAVATPKTKRPKMGPEGDSAEDIVQWYLDNDMPQAIVRYGIYTDNKGEIIRKHVKRIVKNTVDNRNLLDEDIQAVKDSPKSVTKSPVSIEGEIVEDKKGIIARRATRLTFIPAEVVGGWVPEDDDFETAQVGEEDEA
jgi:hypothetical protein